MTRTSSSRSTRAWARIAHREATLTRRVIFLDIDGVLAPIRTWDRYGDLDAACVQVLNDIVASGGADVVVTSTWRHGRTVGELQEMLDACGFAGRVLQRPIRQRTILLFNDRR